MPKQSASQQKTIEQVMHEEKHGELKTSTGKPVRSRKQAIAIALHEAGASNEETQPKTSKNSLKQKPRKSGGRPIKTKPKNGGRNTKDLWQHNDLFENVDALHAIVWDGRISAMKTRGPSAYYHET